MKHLYHVVVIGLVVSLLSAAYGCDVPIDKALDTLNKAINALNNAPAGWDAAAKDAIDELGKIGTKTAKDVLAAVQSTYTTMLADTTIAAFCTADFFGIRLVQRLQEIRHTFFPNNSPAPTKIPVVCLTVPDEIQPGVTGIVKFQGFDFEAFDRTQFAVDLENASSGNVVIPSVGAVDRTSNYLLQVDIQCASASSIKCKQFISLDRSVHYRLALKWNSQPAIGKGGGRSELPIVFPTITPVPSPTPKPSNLFSIAVTTGDLPDAGTDAVVKIKLHGDQSEIDWTVLDIANHDDRKRGQTDIYTLSNDKDLGNILWLEIKHDNSDTCGVTNPNCEGPGWYLEKIVITNQFTVKQWIFIVQRWLAADGRCGGIDQIFHPTTTANPPKPCK